MVSTLNRRSILFHVFDVTLNIVIIVAIVGIIRTFIVSPFQIEGNSMIETLEHKEYIVINKFRYLFGHPNRGDIVVFRPPTDQSKYYVKRVIGLPGETVVVKDGNVYLREETKGDILLNESSYLSPANEGKTYRFNSNGGISAGDTSEEVFEVPQGQYLVLGDNRQGSLDSRSFAYLGTHQTAYVPESNIKGSVWFVALPVTKIHAFEAPEYQL
ncbi:MAG: signal peptidase I [Candidatus Peribacteraceae bacterium]|nr:signal peptidase I [Candidatus Peribacteraceae bacterium]